MKVVQLGALPIDTDKCGINVVGTHATDARRKNNWIGRAHRDGPHVRRQTEGFSIAYIDLDRFKQLNDRRGHAAGDDCLKTVASLVQKTICQPDSFFRIAGDEFVLVLQGAGESEAFATLDRIKGIVANESARRDWGVGISFGIVTLAAGCEMDIDALLELADGRMYAAKRKAA